jgi:hypothetical protein
MTARGESCADESTFHYCNKISKAANIIKRKVYFAHIFSGGSKSRIPLFRPLSKAADGRTSGQKHLCGTAFNPKQRVRERGWCSTIPSRAHSQ